LFIPKEEFWGAMDIVPLIILANFFLGIYTNLSVWYKLIDKTYIGAIISVVGAIITLVINFVFIPKYSFYASAAATLLAYGSMMMLSYYLGRKKYPIPYDFKAILTYLVLAITLSSISFYVPILRATYVFGIVSILGFSYYIFRQEKELIHKILKR
jgi:O-antigen/teichoic acid export membrane protein